ncbi:MAG: M14 family zinc carboxypeptidase [Pseudomonadota bacterium]
MRVTAAALVGVLCLWTHAAAENSPSLQVENPPSLQVENPPSVQMEDAPSLQMETPPPLQVENPPSLQVDYLCEKIDRKLSSVTEEECLGAGLQPSGAVSNRETTLAYRDFLPETGKPVGRVLLVGGIHGDEYSSVSVVFKWVELLKDNHGSQFHWRVVPLLNPDGLLRPPNESQRMNENGVDLNRNFPTPNWETDAPKYWIERTRRNKRRYPGPAALSEPESAWLAEQIETFKPDAVVSVHAPHGIVDFDGPKLPPDNLGPLELRLLGTYPGSMGRFIGVHMGIPMLTVELESAGRMPDKGDINDIWLDMVGWLESKVSPVNAALNGDGTEATISAPAASLIQAPPQDGEKDTKPN